MTGGLGQIGHNGGPTLERGHSWRTFQWKRARERAMPKTMPLEIIKMRVRRAAELGMDYKTYARYRQATGHDILALLFSSNALRVIGATATIPDLETRHLTVVQRAEKLALVHRPQTPSTVLRLNPVIDAAAAAPRFTDSWASMRDQVSAFLQGQSVPPRAVLVIGDAPFEADWATAARTSGYLASAEFFPHQAQMSPTV